MDRPVLTLIVVATEDGFIARAPGHAPHDWASVEEQAIFFKHVGRADWAIMGRGTHEAADRRDRRRIVFSSQAPEPHWRRQTQVWCDPVNLAPSDLPMMVDGVHPLRNGVILGGTTVHDWFRDHGAIDRVLLTVEPVTFGSGLPIFSDQRPGKPEAALEAAGFCKTAEEVLNASGTRLLTYSPASS